MQCANIVSTLARFRQMNKQFDRLDPVIVQPERLKTSGVNEIKNIGQSLRASFSLREILNFQSYAGKDINQQVQTEP